MKSFINDITRDIRIHLSKSERKCWNNLTENQRTALRDLSRDESIGIKPADKGGILVIMDSDKYKAACLQQLENPEFFEEISCRGS